MLQHSPGRAASKHLGLRDSSAKYQKSFECLALCYESVRFIETIGLRASSSIWASEKRVSRERASERRRREGPSLARSSFAQIGDLARRLWKRRLVNDLSVSATKIKLLSTQINFYFLMTNQTPALLVQRAWWTRAAVMSLQCLYFRYIWKSRWPPLTVRRAISRRSHRNIGDYE